MSVELGRMLYEAMYPENHTRYPRGRKPWRVIDTAAKERFQQAAEAFAVELLDALGQKVNEATPVIGGVDETYTTREIGLWLENVREHLLDTGEMWDAA